jgi:hypothetical protein
LKFWIEGVVWRYGHSWGGKGHPRGRRDRRHIWLSKDQISLKEKTRKGDLPSSSLRFRSVLRYPSISRLT